MEEAKQGVDKFVSGEWGNRECKNCSDLISTQIDRVNQLIKEVLSEPFEAKDFFINLTHRMLCELGDYSPFEIKVVIMPVDENGDIREEEISRDSLGEFKIDWFTEPVRNGEFEFSSDRDADGYVIVKIEPKKLSSQRWYSHSKNIKRLDGSNKNKILETNIRETAVGA